MRSFLVRLHFYIGLFVGPFLFITALSGVLYVLTPQIERKLYADALLTDSRGPAQSLAAGRGRAGVSGRGSERLGRSARTRRGPDDANPVLGRLSGVVREQDDLHRPGEPVDQGRHDHLRDERHPAFRITLDYLHRNLLLGEWGRYYSELAASWLWVVALGGLALWATGPRRRRALRDMPPAQRRRCIHATLGVTTAIGLVTPFVSLELDAPGLVTSTHDHHHAAPDLTAREDRLGDLDAVAAASRAAGIDSPSIEIRLPKPDQAWSVREYDRRWPTQVDTIALHPETLAVTSRADFESFTLVPKLIRWAIDAHMGVLFGLPNQILMALIAIGLMATIVYGYAMWWRRRSDEDEVEPLTMAWARLSAKARVTWVLLACVFGWGLPVLGVSLGVFLAIDMLRPAAGRRVAPGTS